jgi:hypothetical protein
MSDYLAQYRAAVKGDWPACRARIAEISGTREALCFGTGWVSSRIHPLSSMDSYGLIADCFARGPPGERLALLGDITEVVGHIAKHMPRAPEDVDMMKRLVNELQIFLNSEAFDAHQVYLACGLGGLLLRGAGMDTVRVFSGFIAT